jgi:hypothetical protein
MRANGFAPKRSSTFRIAILLEQPVEEPNAEKSECRSDRNESRQLDAQRYPKLFQASNSRCSSLDAERPAFARLIDCRPARLAASAPLDRKPVSRRRVSRNACVSGHRQDGCISAYAILSHDAAPNQ